MWERMRSEKMAYPDLRNEEMAHLFAFLYTARYVDEPGDSAKGRGLFRSKACVRCHSIGGGGNEIGPDLSAIQGVDTPIRWTEAMWNHAPAMEKSAARMGLPWPRFADHEMNDLLAYVRANSTGQRRETELLPANPARGWKIIQSKSCLECHTVRGKGGHIGPELGPDRPEPLTIVQFAGLMWNHSPQMWKALKAHSIPRPVFQGKDIADIVAFLSSLRYFEPIGSPHMGQTLFTDRGCAHCHGVSAEGSRGGPGLRGRRQAATTITLATALWQHGPKMYERTRQLGRPWPTLSDADVGDVVAFLNSAVTKE
jgi:cytochrome c2